VHRAILAGLSDLAKSRREHSCPWGSETQIRSRGESAVHVDQAAEEITSANVSRVHTHRGLVFGHGRRKGESAMWPPSLVVGGLSLERPIEMASTQDDRPVQTLGPDSGAF
jgi:hypothetical protein